MKSIILFYLYTVVPFLLVIYLGRNHSIKPEIFPFYLLFWAFLFRPVIFYFHFKKLEGFQSKDIWKCLNPIWLFQHEVSIIFK